MSRDPTALAGRERELATLARELAAAKGGENRTILLHGEAGIGKTALMDAACRAVAGDAALLSARNLPLAMRVPNLAVRALLKQAGALDDADAARQPLHVALDATVDRLAAERLVVIAVDDLQWADPSTLDAIMYLAGGSEDRPLAIVATIRSGSGRPVDRWRADLQRLPGARAIEIGPLDRLGMRDLVASLLGAPAHESLVSDVLARTQGNPYHARLLLEGVDPTATAGPAAVAPDLESALLQAWSQLPEETRELCVMLALHGKPVRPRVLARVDPAWREAERALRPAVATSVLEQDDAGRLWFHHPLIAEILEASIPDIERRERHAALARSTALAVGQEEVRSADLLVDLADHLAAAGDAHGCMDASRLAIDALAGSGQRMTRLRLVRRCVELLEDDPNASASEARELHEAWLSAAAEASADDDEYAASTALLATVDRDTDPLHAAELLLRRQLLSFRIGGGLPSSAPARDALGLASVAPDSRQFALALTELAHAEILEADPRCAAHTAEAIERATALGDTEVLSYALAVGAQLAALTRDLDRARSLAEQAHQVAMPSGHHWPAMLAAFWVAYAMPTYRAAAERLRAYREQFAAAGAPYLVTATIALTEARSWLTIGETAAARAALRLVRAEDPPAYLDLGLRIVSAQLAAQQGLVDEADAHLLRARERFPELPAYLTSQHAIAQALTRFADDDASGVLDVLRPALAGRPTDSLCEWLVPLAARALADAVQSARDQRDDPAAPLAELDDLEAAFPEVIRRTLGVTYPADLVALDALYAAERSRARDLGDAGQRWADAADTCAAAELAWEEAYACLRAAEHGLTHDHGSRDTAAELLRRGAALARRIEADSLTTELESLALWSRVRLHANGPVDVDAVAISGLPLTRRERELLPYVVDGRTYAEIAGLLTISEKTVSSHISNLLRKTGAANRVDLARLAGAGSRRGGHRGGGVRHR